MKIYLAGGFRTNWQERVKDEAAQHQYYDPKTEADQNFAYRWTNSEIEAMKSCDLVLAYFELSNPSGLGLAKEIGWATILNKPVIYVDEHERINLFLASCSKRLYSKLQPAIDYLASLPMVD